MIGGIMPAVTPVGNVGIVSKKPIRTPDQILKDRAEQRRIVREEMRYDELKNKAKNGELSTDEKAEFAYMQINKALESFAENPPVCYLA